MPASGTWIGVPIGAAMSRPACVVPPRTPKPEVTRPVSIRTPPAAVVAAPAAPGAFRAASAAFAALAAFAASAAFFAVSTACRCRSAALTRSSAFATTGSGVTGATAGWGVATSGASAAADSGPAPTNSSTPSRRTLAPSVASGSTCASAVWPAAARVPPARAVATTRLRSAGDSCGTDRMEAWWAPPTPAAAVTAGSGGPRCARRPPGERCRATTFPSGSRRGGRPVGSGGPLGGAVLSGSRPCRYLIRRRR